MIEANGLKLTHQIQTPQQRMDRCSFSNFSLLS